jgi:NSS family neurotransmitter:Na+ symporter
VFAGFTSMVSIIEVVVAGVRDKLGLSRQAAAIAVITPMAIISLLLFPTTAGLYFLDVFDAFVNQYGILAAGLVAIICVGWIAGKLPLFSRHLSRLSSIPANWVWILFIGAIVPVALAYMLATQLMKDTSEVYGGYPPEFVAVFGWGMVIALVVVAIILAALPWSKRVDPTFDEAAEEAEVEAIYQARLARERGEKPASPAAVNEKE